MFKDKILPIGFLASALTLSGMVVATAQTAGTEVQPATVAPAEMVIPVGIVAELRLEVQLPLSPMSSCHANDLGGAES
jgi:hypothetical protein